MAKTSPAAAPPQQPKSQNRRRFYRRSKPFQGMLYAQQGERVPTVGLDASGGGMCILLQQPVTDVNAEVTVGAVIQDKPFSLIGKVRWSDVVKVKGVDHYRYGLELQSIADEDWDRLMMWTIESDPELVEGATLSVDQRDSLITPDTQKAIARELLRRERIDPFSEQHLPLIEYSFVRYAMRQGVPYVWLKVRSRCSDRLLHTINDFMTNILVGSEDGHVKIVD